MMAHRLMELLIQRLRMFQPSSQPAMPATTDLPAPLADPSAHAPSPTAALVLPVIRLGIVVLLLIRLPLLLHQGLRELFLLVLLRLPLLLLVRHLLP